MAPQGRRTLLLDGYNEVDGTWASESIGGKVLAALRVGNYLKHAATYAGVSEWAVHQWLSKGRKYIDDADPDEGVDIGTVPERDRPYVHFAQSVTHARGSSIIDLVTLMRHAARDDWRAADRLLQLIDPENFQPKSRVEHSGPDGGPIHMERTTRVLEALGDLID